MYSVILSYLSAVTFGKITGDLQNNNSILFLLLQTLILLIIAYALGCGLKSKRFNDFLGRTRIGRTLNKNFWRDHFVEGVFYRIHIKGTDVYYEGQVTSVEEHSHAPFIELSEYRVLSIDGLKEIQNYITFNKRNQSPNNEKRTMIIGMDSVDYIIAIDTQNIK